MNEQRFFWLRAVALTAVAVAIGVVGVTRVQDRSAGIRDAARLAALDDELRGVFELNRQIEADLVRQLDPVKMIEDAEQRGMVAPDPESTVEVP